MSQVQPAQKNANSYVRAAIRAGVIGNFADQLHIFLPVLALAPALPYLYGTDSGAATTGPSIAVVMMALLIGRPVGAIIFGQVADRFGRTSTTQFAIAGTALSTLMIALVPSAATIGSLTAWWILIFRFTGGVFLAGEYSAAIPLAMEWSKPRLRGWFSGLIMAMAPLAQATIAFVTFGLLRLVGNDAYAHGIWRLSFVAGALASIGVLIMYRRTVKDHPEVTNERVRKNRSGKERLPLGSLLWGRHRRAFWHMFVLMSGMWCMTQMVAIYIAAHLRDVQHLDAGAVAIAMAFAAIGQAIAMALVGNLSTRVGRRRLFIGWGIFAAIAGPLAWLATTGAAAQGAQIWLVAAGLIALQVVTVPIYGPVGAYLAEGFTATVRSSGYGIAYSASIILPALYPYYLPTLQRWFGVSLAPILVLALGGILVAAGAAFGPRRPLVSESEPLQHAE